MEWRRAAGRRAGPFKNGGLPARSGERIIAWLRWRFGGAGRQLWNKGGGMLDLELQGKLALITGGSDGLGRAAAARLAAEGAKVALCARRREPLEQAAAELRAAGGEALAIVADVTRAEDCERFAAEAVRAFGGVDILLNNAGTSAAKGLEEVDDAAWYADIDLKLMAAVRLCRAVIPLMRARGGGAIVNATIVGGKAPAARGLPTTVTRAAGINLTKSLANQYAADNVRVNTICIGLIKSAQWQRRAGARPIAELYAEMGRRVPLGRMGEAEEYADLVAFLVSARAAFITGAAINLDGGMGATV
jgi:3-oxoacyl-[acyl-carrier protein] reductase